MIPNLLAYLPPPPTNGFHVGPLFFHFYGLAIAIGVLCAFWLARKRWQDLGRDPAQIEIAGIWAVVAGFIGGRLAYVSTHSGDFRGRWLHVFAIWEGGLALYGGLTLGQLLQPGAVRHPHQGALGAGGRAGPPAGPLPGVRHLPPDVFVREPVGPGDRRGAAVAERAPQAAHRQHRPVLPGDVRVGAVPAGADPHRHDLPAAGPVPQRLGVAGGGHRRRRVAVPARGASPANRQAPGRR